MPAVPPVYRPDAGGRIQRTSDRPERPVATRGPVLGVVQARLRKFEGQKELIRLLTNSGVVIEDHKERDRLYGIAEEIGAREDTTKDNVTERILANPQIATVFHTSRMTIDTSPWKAPSAGLTPLEAQVLGVLKNITFFSGTKLEFLDALRMHGLNPSEGGKKGGGSDTQSLGVKRETHLKESQKKVYVTRSFKEASGYAEKGTQPALVFVPTSQQTSLTVDPRSQTGFYSEKALPMVDQVGGVFGSGVIGTIRDELIAQGESVETRDIRAAYLGLLEKGALPQRAEQIGQLQDLKNYWVPILNRLADPDQGPINTAAATIIEVLYSADEYDQLDILRRLKPVKNSSGEITGVIGFLRGG